MVKTLALVLTIYWMARFKAGFDPPRVGAFDPKAMRLFVPVLLLYAATTAVSLWGGSLLRPLGANDALVLRVGIGFSIFTLVLGILLDGWKVGAAVGNPYLGPLQSARMVAPQTPWSVAFSILMMLPLMIAHYAVVPLAIGASPLLLWALMALDALLVGYLAAVLAATSFIVAARAANRRRIALLPVTA